MRNVEWQLTVGLEVHAELNTKTKIFCGCQNAFGAPPNTLCCPVCLGLPGALPVLNQAVVEDAVRLGLALGADVHPVSRMERKHYSYPDSPKAYQITQLSAPICTGGSVSFWLDGALHQVALTRIQMEEDAGKLLYDAAGNTLVDYNRCGVPLLEIVTEPQLHSAREAKAFLEELTRVLLYLGISDAKMQEGSVRADVNVSWGREALGPRVELKNVSSFGAVVRGIEAEAARQRAFLDAGGVVTQETRRWDDARGESVLLRGKESAEDYRFFPEPDLPDVRLEQHWIDSLKETAPELPAARQGRYQAMGFPPEKAAALAADRARSDFYDACCAEAPQAAVACANWLLGDVARLLRRRSQRLEETMLTPHKLCGLQALVDAKELSGAAAKEVLAVLLERDCAPREAARALDLLGLADGAALGALAAGVLAQNPKAVEDYRRGRQNALGYLIGQCRRAGGGKADPEQLKSLLLQLLENC